jgi:hypothetical protein
MISALAEIIFRVAEIILAVAEMVLPVAKLPFPVAEIVSAQREKVPWRVRKILQLEELFPPPAEPT